MAQKAGSLTEDPEAADQQGRSEDNVRSCSYH